MSAARRPWSSMRAAARSLVQRFRRIAAAPDWGDFRRVEPFNRNYGSVRGLPVDRYYIEEFLQFHAGDIRGRALEVGDATYTLRYGRGRVSQVDVLHVTMGNPHATIVANLETGDGVPRDAFDCMILTQVLPFIFDVRAAVRHCHAALRGGGILLATLPAIAQISRYDQERWGDFWRFTSQGATRLFDEVFGAEHVTCEARGNLLAATALLHGIASEELTAEELSARDRDYEVLITLRAQKASVP